MHRREKAAIVELNHYFNQVFIEQTQSLKRLLKEDLGLSNWDETFQLLAPLREPLTEDEKYIDSQISLGIFDDVATAVTEEFIQCRKQFYLQRSLILTLAEEILSENDEEGVAGEDLCVNIISRCSFFVEPHRSAILSLLSRKQKKRRRSLEEESVPMEEKRNWFMKVLQFPLLERDLKLGYDHAFGDCNQLSISKLEQAFDFVGLQKPTLSEMNKMIMEANNFDSIIKLILDTN